MMTDNITVEVLPDGSLKIETDRVSAPNHGSAEMLLREIFKLCGGRSEIKHKHGYSLAHSHEHTHEHHHQ